MKNSRRGETVSMSTENYLLNENVRKIVQILILVVSFSTESK